LDFLPFVISLSLAGFVNKISGRKYLRNGWEFAAPDAEATKIAIQLWGIRPTSDNAVRVKDNRLSSIIRAVSGIGLSALSATIFVFLIVVVGEISNRQLLAHQGPQAPTHTTDYEALCARLQAQFAAGGPVDAIPPIPTDVIVENGVGRVVAAHARCLADLAKQQGIRQISVAFNVVGGDGSTLREIQDNAGNRRPITDFPTASVEQRAVNQGHAVLMEESGGTYVVPVRINGAITLNFVVDTGASDVLLPVDVVLTLARTGTIAEGDYIGDEAYHLADGSTIKSARFVLRQLQVGDQVLQNVPASIGDVRGVPLLGQSFLSQFTSWTIDNDRHALLLGPQRREGKIKAPPSLGRNGLR
jgi:clan AA aspartic protease (TIGR02281 family)